MQPTAATTLTLKAAALARAAPEQWRDFVAAFADFAEVHRENLVQSQLAELPINQGRAQIVGAVSRSLKNALTDADKLNKDKRL